MLAPKVGEDLAAYLNSKTLNEIAAAVNAVLMRSGSGKGYFENAFQNGEILVDLPDTVTADIYSVVILGESLAANIFSDMRPVFSGSVAESQYVFNSSNKIAVLTESPVSGSLTAARFAGIVPAMVKIGPDGGTDFVQPAADGSAEMVTTTQNTGIRILWMNPEATADTAKICMIFLSGVTVPEQEYSGPFKIDLVYADGVPESVTVAGGTITAYNNKGTLAIEIPDFSTSYSGDISFYITGEPDGSAAAIVAAATAPANTVAYIGSVTAITEGEKTVYNINQSLKNEVSYKIEDEADPESVTEYAVILDAGAASLLNVQKTETVDAVTGKTVVTFTFSLNGNIAVGGGYLKSENGGIVGISPTTCEE